MKGNKMYCQSFQKAVRRREMGRKTKLICIYFLRSQSCFISNNVLKRLAVFYQFSKANNKVDKR